MSIQKRPWRQALVYLLQSVTMFAWSLFILSLFWQDKVQYYIALAWKCGYSGELPPSMCWLPSSFIGR